MSKFFNTGFKFEGDSTFNQVGGDLHKGNVIHHHPGAANSNNVSLGDTVESSSIIRTTGLNNTPTLGPMAGSDKNSHRIDGRQVDQHHQHNGLDQEHLRSYAGGRRAEPHRPNDIPPGPSSEREPQVQGMYEQSHQRRGAAKPPQKAAPDRHHHSSYNTPPTTPTRTNRNPASKPHAATTEQSQKSGGGYTGKSSYRTAD
ncbi:hypothetical protein BD779DRAFT_259020 [Infundibulicybe gibba]|nr:hypothetical protein BD779DRAFT_259020 [Infundibulicybe gibba]